MNDQVVGERETAVTRVRSIQSRLTQVLAIGLMGTLGLGTLTWYYANAMSRPGLARQNAQNLSSVHAQGEMALPSLGKIEEPVWQSSPASVSATLPEIPQMSGLVSPYNNSAPAAVAVPAKTPTQIAAERRLSGSVFSRQGLSGGAAAAVRAEGGELASLLQPSAASTLNAQVLPTQALLLPKGAFLDCTLETAIDSTLPGMTTCVLATDTFSVNGQVVLMERGTKLVGETRGQVQQGAARVFVVWTEARTPTGVIVPLDSPGADELGRSGLPGNINRHFWERFGAAVLVSVIDGAIQGAVQSSRSNGTVLVNPSGSQGVLTEVLKSTINISPTVVKQHGDRIQVLVAKDLDFRSVYELKTSHLH